ncbi:SDR family NAD(P)-dependent oxidoreductase, partial [Nocardia abscessus]|uniref:SDR family NAD(P)-dependent oxidoreductase n=1 Tax=Nocardia abscessus TaxID=120957 RepID=UPI0024553CAA
MRITGSGYPGIDLREARVLITGGGRGIGRATAAAFAAKGAQVVLADVDKPAADAAAAAIGASAFELDVRARDEWDAGVAAAGGVGGFRRHAMTYCEVGVELEPFGEPRIAEVGPG